MIAVMVVRWVVVAGYTGKSSTVALAQSREETVMNGLIAAAIFTQEIVQ
jgi:hypothetical protein